MIVRRRQEIDLLRSKYGELEVGPNYDYVLFKQFKLPEGWASDYTELLVIVPSGYPITPPDNFYVPQGFRLNTGAQPSNYSEGQNHLGRQWGAFSVHIRTETWSPSSDLLNGSNLLTFIITVVEKRLNELN